MKKIIWITASIFIVMLVGCSTTYNAVSSDYDKSVDFTKYKTFSWLPDKADTINSPYNNAIIRNNIRNYFGLCMSDRGYSFDAENPDLLMQLVITNTKKKGSFLLILRFIIISHIITAAIIIILIPLLITIVIILRIRMGLFRLL